MTNSCPLENCWKAIKINFKPLYTSFIELLSCSLCEFWLKTRQPEWRQRLWEGQTIRPGGWAVWLWPTTARPRWLRQKIGRWKGLEISTVAAVLCNKNCYEQAACCSLGRRRNEKWHFAAHARRNKPRKLITKLIASASEPFIFIIFIV